MNEQLRCENVERAGPEIAFRGVGLDFAGSKSGARVLSDLSFAIPKNEFIAILGPSGCGKTTILRLTAGLIKPSLGEILVQGQSPVPGRQSSFVFQSFRLIPWLSALENIEFALRPTGLSRLDRREKARHYLSLVGLERAAEAWPQELSGGMKQRLALARALASESDILLMDEPFASLDAQARELMQGELLRLLEVRKSTVLFVTHSVDEALSLSDRILLFSPKPTRLIEQIKVPFDHPRGVQDLRADPEFLRLRQHLWSRLREMVLSDPASDFYGRQGSDVSGPPLLG